MGEASYDSSLEPLAISVIKVNHKYGGSVYPSTNCFSAGPIKYRQARNVLM